mgnify:FL=1|jgi:2-oxoglutarate dehydrogenase E2 component (dihydrolipoamide succinyltransferase)|tara:strand:+ start:1372 stop:2565 length:1194 start_codon:yes stop_codon:yes gene_type:complete
MSIDIKSPTFPESVADGTIANWVKKEGEGVKQDEVIAEIETDKVVLEVLAPVDGTLTKIVKQEGEVVNSSELIAEFNEGNVETEILDSSGKEDASDKKPVKSKKLGPAAKRIIAEEDINPDEVISTGKDGRVTKADLVNHINKTEDNDISKPKTATQNNLSFSDSRDEKRVPMSRLRATIANRLLSVKQETAMLTTFNEVDMQPIKELRSKYGAEFEKEHGVKLGFMGFFVIAAVQALKKFPLVNASIDKTDIVYHGYQDIGVAVSTERGLVVPVIRDADMMSLPDIEKSILDYSNKAREGKLSIDDMQGGTFTISNGGVFGSLLSTPILNAPQTAILGMHNIQDRPVAIDNEVVIRPMMYLAMSYDHRLLDGKEAVTFLVSIKEQLESPERLLLNL